MQCGIVGCFAKAPQSFFDFAYSYAAPREADAKANKMLLKQLAFWRPF